MGVKARRLEEQKAIKRRNRILAMSLGFIVASLGVGFAVYRESPPEATADVAGVAARVQFMSLMNGLEHAPDFQLYPASIKQRLAALTAENRERKIVVTMVPEANSVDNKVFMATPMSAEKPTILIFAPRFLELQRTQSKEMFTSIVITALFHEQIHLELWPEKNPVVDPDAVFEEEARAYEKTLLQVVRPLRENGNRVLVDYIMLDDALKACGDKKDCPGFQQALREYLSPH